MISASAARGAPGTSLATGLHHAVVDVRSMNETRFGTLHESPAQVNRDHPREEDEALQGVPRGVVGENDPTALQKLGSANSMATRSGA